MKALARVDLLILDDWGPEKLDDDQRRDLLEIVEDRYERRSTIVTTQIPVDHWWELIGNPTIADAVLDRLVHNAYRIELTGESLRRRRPTHRIHRPLDLSLNSIQSSSTIQEQTKEVAGFSLECIAGFVGIRGS